MMRATDEDLKAKREKERERESYFVSLSSSFSLRRTRKKIILQTPIFFNLNFVIAL